MEAPSDPWGPAENSPCPRKGRPMMCFAPFGAGRKCALPPAGPATFGPKSCQARGWCGPSWNPGGAECPKRSQYLGQFLPWSGILGSFAWQLSGPKVARLRGAVGGPRGVQGLRRAFWVGPRDFVKTFLCHKRDQIATPRAENRANLQSKMRPRQLWPRGIPGAPKMDRTLTP